MNNEKLAKVIHNSYWCLWEDFNVRPPLDRKEWNYLNPKQRKVMRMLASWIKYSLKCEEKI